MAKVSLNGAKGLLCGHRAADRGLKGYATVANNVLVGKDSTYEPVPAFTAKGALAAANIDRMLKDQTNASVLRSVYSGGVTYRLESYDVASANTWYTVDNARAYTASATVRGTTYLLANSGLRRLSSDATTTYDATIPEGIPVSAASSVGGGGWLPSGAYAGYLCVWGRTIESDANSFYLGAPTMRTVVKNTHASESGDAVVIITIPAVVTTTSHFVQLYRTDPVSIPAGSTEAPDPGYRFYLVYEGYATSAQIADGYIIITDDVPDGNGTYDLYTNDSQLGPAAAAYPCEASARGTSGYGALAYFSGSLWATNYNPRPNIEIAIVDATKWASVAMTVGVTSGLTSVTSATEVNVGATFVHATYFTPGTYVTAKTGAGPYTYTMSAQAIGTSGGVAITASSTFRVGNYRFFATGSGSEDHDDSSFAYFSTTNPASDAEWTAQSLARTISSAASGAYYRGEYVSGSNMQPGLMKITQLDRTASVGTVQFYPVQGSSSPFTPTLLTSTTMAVAPDRSVLTFSGQDQGSCLPEAWPPSNSLSITNQPDILDIAPLRGALIVLCPYGVYRVSGSYPNFAIELIDSSYQFWASDTNPGQGMVVYNNTAFALSTSGLVGITESAVRPAQATPEPLVGLSDPPGRMFLHETLGLIFIPTDTGYTYIYDILADAWTTTDMTGLVADCGVFRSADLKLYTSSGQTSYAQTDPQLAASSYYTTSAALTITAVAGNVISCAVPGGMSTNTVVVQGVNSSVVTAFDGSTITLNDATGFAAGAATAYYGYVSTVRYAPIVSPMGVMKTFEGGAVVFDSNGVDVTDPAVIDDEGRERRIRVITSTELYPDGDTSTHMQTSVPVPASQRFISGANTRRGSVLTVEWQILVAGNKFRVAGVDVNVTAEGAHIGR